MKFFIRYIVDIVVGLLRRSWYLFKMKDLKKQLDKEKMEVIDAKKDSDDAVSDFESEYSKLLSQKDKNK